jgi:hypothetical protein
MAQIESAVLPSGALTANILEIEVPCGKLREMRSLLDLSSLQITA